MKKLWHILKHVAGFVIIILSLCLCWSLAYLVTSFIYHHIGKHPNAFLMQVINSLFGFFIFGSIIFTLTRIFNPQKKQMEYLRSLNDALMEIAKGNFNVSITLPTKREDHPRNPFGVLAKNIHHMAGELVEMEKMRQEFVSNVSHEIQSPLTSISGFAQALQSEKLNWEERLRYLGIIETESQRLSKLSENLLKLTSLESEHHPFEAKTFRLDHQLRNIILSCEPQWVKKEIDMDISLEKVSIVADEDLMNQVWMNLINNAIKFTPLKGIIGVSLKKRDENVVVRISDTGIGMSEEEQLHIFERFYKADKSRNREQGGNGLGLSIVKKIIEMHNGNIKVESNRSKGTTFVVRLPLYYNENAEKG